MSIPAVIEEKSWDLSAIGLKLTDPDLPLTEFSELCWMLGRFHEAVRFAIGDAILIGEAMYGEDCYQSIEEMNLSEEARREYVRVAQRVPRSRRRSGLSWSHHRAVAALDPPQQKEWLKRAADEQLSHHALRSALREGGVQSKPAGFDSPALSECSCCGRPL